MRTRRNPTPSLLAALPVAVGAVMAACLADPDPRGGGNFSPTGPGDTLAVPDPESEVMAQENDSHKCTDEDDAPKCEQDDLVVEGERPCKGFGKVWDNVNGACRCLGSLVPDGDGGGCVFDGDPPTGGPGPGYGGKLPRGGDNGDDDDEVEDDTTKLHVTLTCDASVDRSSFVTCRATTKNTTGTVFYQWAFSPNPDRVRIRDGMDAPRLPPVEKDSTSSDTWSGTAAAGGNASVMARDSMRFAHSHVKFKVTDQGLTISSSFSEGENLTDALWPGVALGKNSNADGNNTVGEILQGSGSVFPVATGPNEGYVIVQDGYSVHRYRHVNERLFSDGPEEIPDGADTVRHWDYLKSRGYDPARLLAGTRAHEGSGHNGKKGHQGQIEKALTVEACGDVSAIVDRIVAPSEDEAERLRDTTRAIATKAFIMAVPHNHVYGNHAGSPIAHWKKGNSPRIGTHFDRYDSTHVRNYTSPGCDWESF